MKNAAWAAGLDEFRSVLRDGLEKRSLSMIGVKTEAGVDYFKTWQQLPAFEYSEIENLYQIHEACRKTRRPKNRPATRAQTLRVRCFCLLDFSLAFSRRRIDHGFHFSRT